MVGSLLTLVCRLRDCLPHLTWNDLKNELLRQYSTILFDSHTTQGFDSLQQGSDELLEMYLHHTSDLLSKIHLTTDMFQILTEGLNHCTMMY